MNVKELADMTISALKAYVSTTMSPFESRVKALEEKDFTVVNNITETIDMESVRDVVKESISSIEIPKPEMVDYEKIKFMIDQSVSSAVSSIVIPVPENGKDGVDGKDGKSLNIEDIRPIIQEVVEKIEIPKPETVDYGKVNAIIYESVKSAISSIEIPKPENGKDGVDGRDAYDIEIEPHINEKEQYERGTFATHKGGLWRAYERTHGMRGWECIVAGISDFDVEYDGERKAVIKITKSTGETVEKEVRIPAIIGKGVWREGMKCEPGDYVQLSGSIWRCKAETDARPTDNSDHWEVAVKRGGTGDSAYQIARKNGFSGSVTDWLDSLGKKPKVEVNP